MNYKILLGMLVAIFMASCSPSVRETDNHDENEAVKENYTAYGDNLELFAEADPFVVGATANVLAHLSLLPDFTAVEQGKLIVTLTVQGKETQVILTKPTRKGIYAFEIKPETQGKGTLLMEWVSENGTLEVLVPDVTVYATEAAAHEAAGKVVVPTTNTTVFTKEQSWKIDFATALPRLEPFGQVIKTTALVQASQGNEFVVVAKTTGVVFFQAGTIIEGMEVKAGQALCTVSSGNFASNNGAVNYAEASSKYEKAKSDYERATELVKDKIVSQREWMAVKAEYEQAKAVYDNLNKHFSASGQSVTSPLTGFVKQVYVKNGSYVEAGQALVEVSSNASLFLTAEVPAKHASVLATVKTATIRTINDNRSYSLESLNGKVVSYGKATTGDGFLIPITLQIRNNGTFVAGSFVEVYLKTVAAEKSLVLPVSALLEEQGTYFVWVQINPERFEKREVFLGGTDGIDVAIKIGIAANERIVTRGAMLIKLAQATGSLDAHSGHVH